MKKFFTGIGTVIGLLVIVLVVIKLTGARVVVDGFSGATPAALQRNVPDGLEVVVSGMVKQTYYFDSDALRRIASVRVRTREVSPAGEIMGAYIYYGVPVLYILEGAAPQKPPDASFDRPLDMLVIFRSAAGQQAAFSYGELTMTDDCAPVTLAYHREPLLPSKNPEKYTANKYKENIPGIRLICPREPDTLRYLDDVKEILLVTPSTPYDFLPPLKKGLKCISTVIQCVRKEEVKTADFQEVEFTGITDWFRIGHGQGIKENSLFQAAGYSLRSFLRKNFPGCGDKDFFMFIACDGYRCLFSGREIFATADGKSMLLIEKLNNTPPKSGKTLGAAADFFVDRNIRGLSYIIKLEIPFEAAKEH